MRPATATPVVPLNPRRRLASRLVTIALPGCVLVNAGLLSARLAQMVWGLFLAMEAGREVAGGLSASSRPSSRSLAAGGGTSPVRPPAASPPSLWLALLAAGLALFGLAAGFRLPGPPTVPVLTYHRIVAAPRRGYPVPTVPPAEFARQLDWLRSRGYHTVSPGYLLAPGPAPGRPLIITFDDGWRDNVAAATLLRQRGFTGVIFVVTGSVGRPLTLTADQLRTLDRHGFTIAAHTVTHPHLDRLTPPQRLAELRQSRLYLERLLGHQVEFFAYPYGSTDLASGSATLVREAGYRLAFASHAFGLNANFLRPSAVRRVLVPSHPWLARLTFFLLLY